ncbi:MAG TPA: hypothetical protein VN598_00355 [Usitatibacter sp.]|nr:hypothetical protein [Usitatibacter sp.]
MTGILHAWALCAFVALAIAGHAPQAAAADGARTNDNLMLDKRIAPARARVAAIQKKLDELRDHPSENDFRTIWVDMPGGAQPRRIPTEEFQARIEHAQAELRDAEQELKALERSLY